MNHPCKIEHRVMTGMMHQTGIIQRTQFPKFLYCNFRLNLGVELQTHCLITRVRLGLQTALLCCLLATAYLWVLTIQRPLSELNDFMRWGYRVYDLKHHSQRCGPEMSIGLTRLNTSKAFHGAASSVSVIFRSNMHTHTTVFLKFHSRLFIF